MKRVIKFETQDGKLHDNFLKAERHADVAYTNAASNLAAKLVKVEKFTKMRDFLDCHLEDFLQLKSLKDDLTLVNEEED